jgi:hypothetical protein
LVDLEYWFEGVAGSSPITRQIEYPSSFYTTFVVVFSAFFALGVISLLVQGFMKDHHPLVKKLNLWGSNFLWMGILGAFWLFLRQAEVGFLGSRMWLIAGLIWLVILIYFIIKYFITLYSLEKAYYKS